MFEDATNKQIKQVRKEAEWEAVMEEEVLKNAAKIKSTTTSSAPNTTNKSQR